MRIDLNPSSMPELSPSGSSASTARVGPNAVNNHVGTTEDVAQLSNGSQAVRALKAQLDQLPDVRQERVQSLKQAINDGSFSVSPDRIAEAMLGNPQASSK